jgi:hypothetical protein
MDVKLSQAAQGERERDRNVIGKVNVQISLLDWRVWIELCYICVGGGREEESVIGLCYYI